MPELIEDYAMIGDCQTAALVSRTGSIDWLCLPRFDSAACFAAILGTPDNGRWLVSPATDVRRIRRQYRENTLVLETEFETDSGAVTVTDCMPPRGEQPILVRLVQGKRGHVPMHLELRIRFDYGSVVPWVRRIADGVQAIAGPNALEIHAGTEMHGKDLTTVADFTVSEGQSIPFSMAWYPSYKDPPRAIDVNQVIRSTADFWEEWSKKCKYDHDWCDAVRRSLITLKALTYAPTGGIVAAPTTSLPEQLGGVRNWDYRYCWVRDSTFTLYALLGAGFTEEAHAWREWLLRAVAGSPSDLQIMYGIAGERRLMEYKVQWLPGYQSAKPVRVGNAASAQFQLDVYGELLDSMLQCRRMGIEPNPAAWDLELALLNFLEKNWQQPDEGIWEVRGGRRQFTHSKVMAWVAMDRAIKSVENFGVQGPVDQWRATRARIHTEVCEQGYSSELNSFVQSYGTKHLDASLLMIPLVGFLPPDDPRVKGTVRAIETGLLKDGFVQRYSTDSSVDGLPPGEGAFLACSFWLADNYYLLKRHDQARALFERLLDLRNDVGLLSEEYDPHAKRLIGNFPQAFSHIALINTARNLAPGMGPADHRVQS